MAVNCTRMIPIDSLFFGDNVRWEGNLEEGTLKVFDSIKRQGWKPNHPLVVVTKENGNKVLVGNCRSRAVLRLRDEKPDKFAEFFPDGKISALVHTNLTDGEEVEIRIDHSHDEDRTPLDEWSEFLAVKQLVLNGMDTEAEIARKLGAIYKKGKNAGQPNRSYIQPRVRLAKLPAFVQDEYKKYCMDRKSTAFRIGMTANLAKAYRAGAHKDDDEVFVAAWKKCLIPPEPEEEKRGKALRPDVALERANAATSTIVKAVLLSATEQGDSLLDLDERVTALERRDTLLTQIEVYMGEHDYAELVDVAQKQATILAEETAKEETAKEETTIKA